MRERSSSFLRWLFPLFLTVLMAAVFLWLWQAPEREARNKLEDLLRQPSKPQEAFPMAPSLPKSRNPSPPDPVVPGDILPEERLPDPVGEFLSRQMDRMHREMERMMEESPLADPIRVLSPDIRETEQAYEIRFPLRQAEDADRIQVDALPDRITISGQMPLGAHGTSTFTKSFTPSAPVDPEGIRREVRADSLTVTIPKQGSAGRKSAPDSGEKSDQAHPEPFHQRRSLPEDVRKQLSQPNEYI